MKGLMKKDISLLLVNRKLYLMVLALALFYLAMGEAMEGIFVPYITYIMLMLGLNTIAYDDADRGMAFLLTLPVSKTSYLREKYAFCLLISSAGWAVSSILLIVIKTAGGNAWKQTITEFGISLVVYLLLCMFLMFLLIPIQLKYGSENSRIALFGVVLVTVGVFMLIYKVSGIDVDGMDRWITSFIDRNAWMLAVAVVVLLALVGVISFRVSAGILEKKEY